MHWLNILLGGSAGTVILGAFGALASRQIKHAVGDVVHTLTADALEAIKADVAELKIQLARETGGNSNGLRQKLNSVAEDVAHLKGAAESTKPPTVVVTQSGGASA